MAIETSGPRGYFAMLTRMIRRAGVRVAENGDEIELRELSHFAVILREAEQTAVDGLRARGKSWSYIASAYGISREAAYKKWGKRGN